MYFMLLKGAFHPFRKQLFCSFDQQIIQLISLNILQWKFQMTVCEQCVKRIQDVSRTVAKKMSMEGMDVAISGSTSIITKYDYLFISIFSVSCTITICKMIDTV